MLFRHIKIRAEDFRFRQFEEKASRLLIFAVDASGSSAFNRLAEAKGAIEYMLSQAYANRDHVCLIAFRDREARLLLPSTRSMVMTKRRLAQLPGGGGTPLAAGLELAAAEGYSARRSGMQPFICILTDGRANIALDGSHQSHFTPSDFTHTKLGPLQIRQNSGVRAQFPIDAAHRVNGRAMHFVGAMGKVDAGHVEALEDQLGQHFL